MAGDDFVLHLLDLLAPLGGVTAKRMFGAHCLLRDGAAFDAVQARRRIAAQLDTLRAHGIRHAVLGAFGCGAFGNPAEQVAAIYRDEIAARAASFNAIDFAIRDAGAGGRGRDTFAAFARVLAGHRA